MHWPIRWYCWTILVWAIAVACAGGHAQGVLVVTEPWVRPGTARQSTETYMQLMSSNGATLIDVGSPLATRVALRSPTGKPIVPMTLTLPAALDVALQPKENRLVLLQLKRDLRIGDRVPLVLTVRNADGSLQEIMVDAEVRLHSPTDDHRHLHQHP